MPISASELQKTTFLRVLVMGPAKAGKTQTTLATCPKPAYVILSDDDSSLEPAQRVTTEFEFDRVQDLSAIKALAEMEKALAAARKGAIEGKYKTVLWDTMTNFAMRLEDGLRTLSDKGKGPDGRQYFKEYHRHLYNITSRLLSLPCHVIVIAHYVEAPGVVIEGQLDKSGKGICPMLTGASRNIIPTLFKDVVFFELKPNGKRVFTVSAEGVWGPGCRSLAGVSELPADVEEFLRQAAQ
jgi:hypothetical protein